MKMILLGLMLLALICVFAIPARAQTGNADFQQAVAAYQQSPNDANAEKVIRMAAAMDKLPPIPEEARRHFVRGTALFKDAKTMDDYDQVAGEFKQAVHLAPWWPDARYNYALVQEAAGVYDWAIKNLKLYLLFKLSEVDARAAQDRIYAIEAKREKAAKAKEESYTQPAAAPQENSFDALLRKIDGRRYTWTDPSGNIMTIDVRGRVLVTGLIPMSYCSARVCGQDHETGRVQIQNSKVINPDSERIFTISEDGGSISEQWPRGAFGKDSFEAILLWKR